MNPLACSPSDLEHEIALGDEGMSCFLIDLNSDFQWPNIGDYKGCLSNCV
jgi:hypothetical protein